MTERRLLIACVGNIFLGDDAFGVEVARRLAAVELPEGARVIDFGIRGIDLTYALLDGYESIILVDAAPRGGAPGTLYVLEPTPGDPSGRECPGSLLDAHGMDPAKVLRLAESLGGRVGRLLLVGCEPGTSAEPDDIQDGLSASVRSAVEEAVPLILSLAERLLRGEEPYAGEANATCVTSDLGFRPSLNDLRRG
jgi:hydrogenase maturation protease